mgnify:CR=1 FL=1
MPEDVGNLLKTKARLWIAPEGEALPDESSVAVEAAWGGNWVALGYTKEPLAFKYEYEEMEFHIEQALAAVDKRKRGEKAMFETVLAEFTALNLAYVSGSNSSAVTTTAAGASQVGYEEIEIGNELFVRKHAIGFEGTFYDSNEVALPVRIFFTRATMQINGNLTFSQKDDDYSGIPVSIQAMADPANNNKMFKLQRVTAPATS